MKRINVYDEDREELAGWFDADRAELFREDRGAVGKTDTSRDLQRLHRTAAGRWVLERYSNWRGTVPHLRYITPDQAREWLIRNNEDDAVERLFGPLDGESGPDLRGRPEVGPAVHVRLNRDLLDRVDAYAAADIPRSRAEAIRELLASALN